MHNEFGRGEDSMSFISQNSAMRNRMLLVSTMIIAMIAALAFASNASAAKSVRVNVLVHYGVKGQTTEKSGNQSELFNGKSLSPSSKVAKIVRSGSGVKLKLHKDEKLVHAAYTYVVPVTQEIVIVREWNGKGVLPLTKTVKYKGKRTKVKLSDVSVYILIPHHASAKVRLPESEHSE